VLIVNRQSLLAYVAILATIGVFFAPALVLGRPLLFRDSAHFYYPLFEWCCREWSAGRVPLWNPLENCGTPVLADATSSVLYPGKVIFALPLGYDFCFNLYIVAHIILAAANCNAVARAWRASPAASALASVGYSCGGAVLFQYCNVVFLVGAAWLPLALLCADRMLRRSSGTASVSLGIVLALMVLGGDPQIAYHVLIACLLYAAILCGRRKGDIAAFAQRHHWLSRLTLCAVASTIAYCLSAAQVLPSMEATSRSDRAVFNRPRNIYEAASLCWRLPNDDLHLNETKLQSIGCGLLGEPATFTHHEAIYEFSVGPWRLAEFFWPNIGGRLFPTNRRWFSLLPAESRVWTPTLYLGLLPAILAVGSLCAPSTNRRELWLKWILILSLLGSFGYYGLGWVVHEFAGAIGTQSKWIDSIGNPVGGLYWMLTTLLPGYVYFRYPAKLMPLAALAICLLAATGFDRVFRRRQKWLVYALAFLAAVSGFSGLVVWLAGRRLLANVTGDDATLGPFDAVGARFDIAAALAQAAAVSLAVGLLVQFAAKQPIYARFAKWMIVLVLAADVWFANAWTVVSVEPAREHASVPLALQIDSEQSSIPKDGVEPRIFRANLATWRPPSFRTSQSANRLAELEDWERQTLLPKYSLLEDVSMVETHGSIASADYRALLYVAKQHGPRQSDKSLTPQPSALRLLGTEFLIVPEKHRFEFATHVDKTIVDWPESAVLWRMRQTMPRCWIVYEVQHLPELKKPLNMTAIEARTREVLFPAGSPRDFAHSAVVETDHPRKDWMSQHATGGLQNEVAGEICEIVHRTSQRVVVEADMSQPGLLVLSDAWYPGWTAWVTTNGTTHTVPIYRTNRVLRGVWLAAGKQTIEFRYQSRSFYIGAAISAASWLLLAAFSINRFARRAKSVML